ncbi:hypothetical protein [Mycetocola zhujimingii]|uniref:hypothetical protein n=1 Tax=Mycetocola zhujimingii TaxID=2079792 RepID=UPI000D34AE0D|nr:hypothetical protein [Mycetocola zhujimingii]AWB86922.1 hypothetical protein C3E77_10045 [Mycetocola zhujimingii]
MKRLLLVAIAAAVAAALTGCVTLFLPSESESAPEIREPQIPAGEPEDWVIVFYESGSDDEAMAAMDALLDTELAADEALVADGLGWIDGNEFGQGSYDLYFIGYDHDEMWAVLEPILATAPLKWTRVEFWDDPDGEATAELTQ